MYLQLVVHLESDDWLHFVSQAGAHYDTTGSLVGEQYVYLCHGYLFVTFLLLFFCVRLIGDVFVLVILTTQHDSTCA